MLPVYVAADGVFESSHSRILIRDLHGVVGGGGEGVPVCWIEGLHCRRLHTQTGSQVSTSPAHFLSPAGSNVDDTDLLQSCHQLLPPLNLCEGLSQSTQLCRRSC